ncbi:MAG: DivIVA domain-containing protein [Acutalibacteraceae bacterium]
MYTADSIREVEFQKSGISGVKATEVYNFVDDVANDFEKLTRQNEELMKKLQVLADCIEEYRKSEDTVKTAILTAQKTADSVVSEAEQKAAALLEEKTKLAENLEKSANEAAEKLMNDTQAKSREILDDATMRANRILAEAEEAAKMKRSEIDKMVNQQLLTYNYIKDEVKNFKESIISAYKEHLDKLTNVPMSSRTLEVYNKNDEPRADSKDATKPTDETQPTE